MQVYVKDNNMNFILNIKFVFVESMGSTNSYIEYTIVIYNKLG